MEQCKKSSLKYMSKIIQKSLLRVFYTWKTILNKPKIAIKAQKIDELPHYSSNTFTDLDGDLTDYKRRQSTTSLASIIKSNPKIFNEQVYLSSIDLPKNLSAPFTKVHNKTKTPHQSINIFEELKASLQTKAQNLNYIKPVLRGSEKKLSQQDAISEKPLYRHQRSNTYSNCSLAIVSSNLTT